MTAAYLDTQPHLLDKWASLNPLGRIGRPDELRGVVTWLASDASTFCTGSEYVRLAVSAPAVQCADTAAHPRARARRLWTCSILMSGGHHAW